jgi:signal transduction histidine kinase
VVLQVPDDLPRIWADPQRAEQVFTNLISNAHRYTPEGGEVTIAARMNGNRVSVSITDTGIGIRPEDQSRIFERFVRVQRGGARPQGSTGLGLAITRALVELHGGTISVKSELGEGSTFTAELPAVNDQGEAA